MKNATVLLILICSVLFGTHIQAADTLEKGFLSPPDSARPWVYWIALNGNLSKEGITADLEAMARVGIGGVIYMEVNQGTPAGPADFAGPLWRDLIKHACNEANRLGLAINMNNDAGWCGSGGPWITPELSMQVLTMSETFVEGPKKFNDLLPQPPPAVVSPLRWRPQLTAATNFYRDIAVLAFPTADGDDVKAAGANPEISVSSGKPGVDGRILMDGDPSTSITLPKPDDAHPQWVQMAFPEPFTARSLTLNFIGWSEHSAHARLQVSDDGQTFRTVREFDAYLTSATVSFDEVSARFFRVVFTGAHKASKELTVSDVRLSPGFRIDGIEGKAAFVKRNFESPTVFPALPGKLVIPRGRIVDLTGRVDTDGRLVWDAPPGKWTVLRIGHTAAGKENNPAPMSGRGLECDKLSKEAVETHFNSLMAKVIDGNKPLAGKTLAATHVDSWEVGSQNWTPRMREEFQRRRGYDLLPFLPVTDGHVVDSLEVSERFLWDMRRTISEMVLDNYAGHLRTLANRNGMYFSMEAYGTDLFDNLACGGRTDEPMGEFWARPELAFASSITRMSSSAHVYGKRIVSAEALTSNNGEKWLSHPGNVKGIADWAFCEGINRFVIHRYALQPWVNPSRVPGVSMGPWGLHYERTQTWWEWSKPWHEYLARCQYLLRQGLFVADICYLQSESAPNSFNVKPKPGTDPHTRPGYNFDLCPAEAVLTRMSVKDGRIVMSDGMNYRVLVLPSATDTMTPQLLRKIKELADGGATVIGTTKPVKAPGLSGYPECDAEVKKIADDLWKSGRILTGKTAEEVLAGMKISPDFAADKNLRCIHRRDGETDIYFVSNPAETNVEAVAAFRVIGKQPEFWQAESGRIEPVAVFSEAGDVTRVPLRLGPAESVFIVFHPVAKGTDPVVAVMHNGRSIFPASAVTNVAADSRVDLRRNASGGITVEARQPGQYELKTASGRTLHCEVPALPPAQELAGSWEVRFDPESGGPESPVAFDRLEDWSKRTEPGIHYYSGTAVYRTTFKSEVRSQESRVFLDLGRVEVMAEVILNGRKLGVLWKPPFLADITEALQVGENTLEVKVVNLWVNRLIGDDQLADDSSRAPDGSLKNWPAWLTEGKPDPTGRYTFTTWKLWKKDDPLLPSGLIGPVTIQAAEVKKIEL